MQCTWQIYKQWQDFQKEVSGYAKSSAKRKLKPKKALTSFFQHLKYSKLNLASSNTLTSCTMHCITRKICNLIKKKGHDTIFKKF